MSPTRQTVWKRVTQTGVCLLVLGFCLVGLGFLEAVDYPRHASFFSALHLDLIFSLIGMGVAGGTLAVGVLLLIVGAIGFATILSKLQLRKLGAALLLVPIAVTVLVGMIAPNVHGILPIFFLVSIPICVIGGVLLFVSLWR